MISEEAPYLLDRIAPVPLGALLVSWAVGWSIGMVVILATMFALSFGGAFWWCWDVWQARQRREQVPGHSTPLR
jgi:hypothetical protein